MPVRLTVHWLLATLVVGCAAFTREEPVGPAPAPPTIEAVGMTAAMMEAAPIHTYVLEDGRTFEISTDETRVVFEGGPGQPFVLGHDATGPFVAVFSSQEGRPAECHIIPAGGGQGIDRGMFIEAEGILWRKTADFRLEVQAPGLGQRYVGVGAFCFNDVAEVFAAVP